MGGVPINTTELHNQATLVHLPYDADKLVDAPTLDFKQGEATGVKGADYSFKDDKGQTRYYKLVAQSEDAGPEADRDHDAAAFVELDKNGDQLKVNGRPNVTVVFGGLNNPGADIDEAARDHFKSSSFSPSFYEGFEARLKDGLNKNGINIDNSNVQAIGHSMGDKHATEFAARHSNAKVLVLDGWDTKDSMVGTAIRKTLLDAGGAPLSDKAFKEDLTKNLRDLQERIVDVRGGAPRTENLTESSYYIADAKHRAKEYLNVDKPRLHATVPPEKDTLVDYAMKNAERFMLTQLKEELKLDGKFSKEDRAELRAAKELLRNSDGIKVADLQTVAYSAYHVADAEAQLKPEKAK